MNTRYNNYLISHQAELASFYNLGLYDEAEKSMLEHMNVIRSKRMNDSTDEWIAALSVLVTESLTVIGSHNTAITRDLIPILMKYQNVLKEIKRKSDENI